MESHQNHQLSMGGYQFSGPIYPTLSLPDFRGLFPVQLVPPWPMGRPMGVPATAVLGCWRLFGFPHSRLYASSAPYPYLLLVSMLWAAPGWWWWWWWWWWRASALLKHPDLIQMQMHSALFWHFVCDCYYWLIVPVFQAAQADQPWNDNNDDRWINNY